MADRSTGGPSDYLAAERTFPAWIRTGLALMGFGFVVARFGLFLQALQIGQWDLQVRPFGPSFWLEKRREKSMTSNSERFGALSPAPFFSTRKWRTASDST